MPDSENDSGDHAMFWVNLIGISLATFLLGTFFWLYGAGVLGFMVMLAGGGANLPDR